MHIEKIMGPPPPSVKGTHTIKQVSDILLRNAITFAVVLNAKNKAVGIITETDIVNHIAHFGKPSTTAAALMTTPVLALQSSQNLSEALKQLDTNHLRKYPVMAHNAIVGSISDKELILHDYNTIKFHRTIQNSILIFFLLFEVIIFTFIVGGIV